MSQFSGLYLYFIAVIGYVLTPVSCPRLECNYTIGYICRHPKKQSLYSSICSGCDFESCGREEWTVWTCKTLLCRQTLAINTNITDSQSADVWLCCELNPHGVGEYSTTMF